MVEIENIETKKIWNILHAIPDPEIPVLSITDLGIVRGVNVDDKQLIHIKITPTYTGCPATEAIAMSIKMAMLENRIKNFKLETVIAPAWTTDWITEEGKQKLKDYGIAPPDKKRLIADDGIQCPQCNSVNTKLISEFGSTPCKSLFQCNDCKEPFDYFKCH